MRSFPSPDEPGLIRVEFDWSPEHGDCYDCGLPAAYVAPDIYGKGKPTTEANLFCSICAAWHASQGARIDYLFESAEATA